MAEAVLREAGLDVGLYVSPHVDDVRDRVRVNGRRIPRSGVVEFVEACRDYVTDRAADGTGPTFFEVLTAMALWYFDREGVDVAVVEVGIGGRHDATSVVEPVASAVTNVTLEHTDVLGQTVEAIARDKAHVAPGGAPLVTAAGGEALEAIREVAGDVVRVGTDAGADVRVDYRGVVDGREGAARLAGDGWSVEADLALLGAHQAVNAGVAAVLARQAAGVDDGAVVRGLRSAHWPGRFEVIEREPLVVLDGAHNPGACAVLTETLSAFDYDGLSLVFGAMHDKDHAGMAEALPRPDRVYTCRPNLDRAEDRDVLARVFDRSLGDDGVEVVAMNAVEAALRRALADAGADDCVLVTGSLYTVGEARRRWTRPSVPVRVDDLGTARSVLERAGVTPAGTWRMRGKAVHRTVRTRLHPRQARIVKEELLSLGGEAALSGLSRQDEELVEVVLMGTLAQFKRLAEKLAGQPYALAGVGEDLRERLGIGVRPPETPYPWADRTAVMGILNVTPDSFYDGGRFDGPDEAVAAAERMVTAGADVVDVGGESTRPGADPVEADVEIDRVVPVVERLADADALVSIDTRKASVARAALDAGADVVNDVSGLADPEMRFVAADRDVPLVVMHSIDTPVEPSTRVTYDDVVTDVLDGLAERVLLAERAGLDRTKVIVDPGIGFGKSAAENFALLDRLDEFGALGCPVLVGHSQKSMFGSLGYDAGDRDAPTVAASALATVRGADVVRVHDVAANVAAVRTAEATLGRGSAPGS